MPQSFDAVESLQVELPAERRKVLVTGASGHIGTYFAEHARERYDLRLMVKDVDDASKHIEPYGAVEQGTLDDLDRLKQLCAGIDTVVHLAGDPSPSAAWASLLETNIIGTYNLFVAAKSAGCRRVIHASSIHAVSGYPKDVQVKTSEPVNPGDLYGVSKCFGEALGRYMATMEGLSVIALRIGAFQPLEKALPKQALGMLDAWVSRRDLQQLIERCIDAEQIQFAIFHGLSDNRFKRLDISDARTLVGYAPQDDLTEVNEAIKALHLSDKVISNSMSDAGQKSGLREQIA